jgi:orotate phosphoribosyltransferase
MSLFQRGDFKLHSGQRSNWRVDCDHLLDEDLKALVAMALEILPAYGEVVGIPTGGTKLASLMQLYINPGSGRLLIVDDVLTTGFSMEEERARHQGKEVVGLVLFAREKPAPWIKAIWART